MTAATGQVLAREGEAGVRSLSVPAETPDRAGGPGHQQSGVWGQVSPQGSISPDETWGV